MFTTIHQSNFINFMNPADSPTQSILSQVGFTFCPTFSTLPFILNSNHNDSQNYAFPRDTSKIDENQLRWKLLDIFKKDKKKYQSICDTFMDVMDLDKMCQTIRALTDYINKTFLEECKSNFEHKRNPNDLSSSQSDESLNQKKPLMIFSSQVSFLSTIFSRDKIEVILQVHTSHQKIQNFLNFLNVSLQSFNFTNEKEWVLMKDEIERYLIKYEKNISKLLQVSESEMKAKGQNKNTVEKQNIHANQQKQAQVHPEIYGSCQINTRLQEELNLKQYKKDIMIIRDKIQELQSTMCTAVRNSFITWYQKFETIVENLKSELNYICKLLEKAKKFEDSAEKYQIIDFLLITRAKGLETTIFLQQIYKTILIKLEQSRQKLYYSVAYTKSTKLSNLKSKDHVELARKEKETNQSVDKTFDKIENLLGVKVQRAEILYHMNEESEVESSEKGDEKLGVLQKVYYANGDKRHGSKELDDQEQMKQKIAYRYHQMKEKRIKKDRREKQKHNQKMEMNIILKSPEKKALFIQLGHEVSNSNAINLKSQSNQSSQSNHSQQPQKMAEQSMSQSDSSSLQFLMSTQPQAQRLAQTKSSNTIPIEQIGKKLLLRNSPAEILNSYQDIDSLSIEEQIDLDLGSFKQIESDEMLMFERGFNDDEIKKMENGGLMDSE